MVLVFSLQIFFFIVQSEIHEFLIVLVIFLVQFTPNVFHINQTPGSCCGMT